MMKTTNRRWKYRIPPQCIPILMALVAVAAGLSIHGTNVYRAERVNVITAAQSDDIAGIRFVMKWQPERALSEMITTPLWQASCHGHLQIVKILVEHGADPNDCAYNTGDSALNMARLAGHDDIARFLRASGADEK
jgi:ankyrin repeat protein